LTIWPEPFRGCGGALALYRRRAAAAARPWHLRWVPVCSSTEPLLGRWLRDEPQLDHPRAVIAGRQNRATGQWGRPWMSPRGGLWISAAMPWQGRPPASAMLIGLAVATGLAERLERRGLEVAIKWPNDLLVDGRKLAGLLPRLVQRGSTLRIVRIGVGLNVENQTPSQGVALHQVLGSAGGSPLLWCAELLQVLDRCMTDAVDLRWCVPEAERRLWSDRVRDPDDGMSWSISGLAPDGALRLRRGAQTRDWTRWSSGSGSLS
jgi:BirA family biotin operon repressor/biotin-[acetyl-CoA-carboxylase] ligase